ncbi:hypothetical protein EDC94DRAFT_502483, partial [Helicostylum pulchrum]
LVTSLDVFIHNNVAIDDCADLSKISYQNTPIAYIRRKTRFKNDYFEFSIKVGNVEMLATGGFWGKLQYTDIVISPFLGSSIPGLPEEITGLVSNPSSCEIFTLNQESNLVNPVRSYRTISQYLKTHSTNLWAFHANSYYDRG